MTLVVARIQRGRIAIASDTQISRGDLALPVVNGIVKTCIINCSTCVAFSNSPELAKRDILTFAAKFRTSAGFAETIDFFERSSEKTNNDYIIAFSHPPRIVKIVDGSRTDSAAKTIWIGDREGFSAFRKYETDRRARIERGRAINAVLFADDLEGSPGSDLYSAMRHVVADRTIPNVGGFVSVISSRPEGFRYSVYSDMLYDWPTGEGDDYLISLTDKLQFGASGENAGYSIAQLSPGFIGANPVAFYIVRAHCLFVYFGPNNGPPHQCCAVSGVAPEMVVRTLFDITGFDWKWSAVVTSAPPSIGERRSLRAEPDNYGIGMSFFTWLNTMPQS